MSPCGEAEEQAPWSRGAEMPCRSPPLPGEECASARREFRWNHGLIVRPEPKTGSGRFFCPGRRKGEWNMNEKIYLMEMQHRTDEHETDRMIAYLKKTAETEIKEDEK